MKKFVKKKSLAPRFCGKDEIPPEIVSSERNLETGKMTHSVKQGYFIECDFSKEFTTFGFVFEDCKFIDCSGVKDLIKNNCIELGCDFPTSGFAAKFPGKYAKEIR